MQFNNDKLVRLWRRGNLNPSGLNEGWTVYQALALGVHYDIGRANEVRKVIYQEIKGDFEKYSYFFPDDDRVHFDAEVERVNQSGEFLIDLILGAAATVFQTEFVLHTPPLRVNDFPEVPEYRKILRLFSLDGVSFGLLTGEFRDPDVEVEQVDEGVPNDNVSDGQNDRQSEDEEMEEELANGTWLDPTQHVIDVHGVSARNKILFILLVPSRANFPTAAEYFEHERPGKVYLLVTSSKRTKRTVLADADIRHCFSVFCQFLPLPWEASERDIQRWVAKIVVPWIVLTALHYEWNGTKVISLCGHNLKTFLVPSIVNRLWLEVANDVALDLSTNRTNPAAYICRRCTRDCPHRSNPRHLNLANFVRLDYTDGRSELFMTRYNMFETDEEIDCPYLAFIKDVYGSGPNADSQVTIDAIMQNLNEYAAARKENVTYCSYLVIIFDGPTMEHLVNATVVELLANEEVYKTLYGGCTEEGAFRKEHFSNKAVIGRLLTKHARIYYVRRRHFDNYAEAAADEALVIQISKTIWNAERKMDGGPSYLCLNLLSGLQQLYKFTNEELAEISGFCKSGIPIFNIDPTDTRKYNGVFEGNYMIVDPVRMHGGPYQQRCFSSSVRQQYDDILRRVPI